MRALPALALALTACTDDVTVVRVTVDARATMHTATSLSLSARDGAERTISTQLGGGGAIAFPTGFTLTPSTGPLTLQLVAHDPDGIPVGRVAGDTVAFLDTIADLTVLLEPDDFVVNRDFSQSYTGFSLDPFATGRQLAASRTGYLVIWSSGTACGGAATCELRGQHLDDRLTASGELSLFATPLMNPSLAVGAGPDRTFVAWDSNLSGGSWRVEGTLLDDQGRVTSPVTVALETGYDDRHPALVPLPDGRFILLYERTPSGAPGIVLARLLAADLSPLPLPPGTTLTVGTLRGSQQARGVALAAGGFAAVLVENDTVGNSSSLRLRSFDAAFQPAIDLRFEPQAAGRLIGPAVVEAADGTLIVAWHEPTPGGGWITLLARVTPSGALHSSLSRAQVGGVLPAPPALALRPGDGAIAVAWTATDGTEVDVRLRLLHPNGLPSGPDILVNTVTTGDQRYPSMVAAHDGGFLLAWQDSSQAPPDTVSPAIRAREIYPVLVRRDGEIGADCGGPADTPCKNTLVCASDTPSVPSRCHVPCALAEGANCPFGGQCHAGACVYDP